MSGSVASSSQQGAPPPRPPEHDQDDDQCDAPTPHMRGGKGGDARSGSKSRCSSAAPQPHQQPNPSRSPHPRPRAGGEQSSRTTTIPGSVATGGARVATGTGVGGSSSTTDSRHPPSHASSSPRTTPRPTKRQPQTPQPQPVPPPPPPPPPPPSFTDQIAQSAVSTTMELLKLATGVTLTTTGKLYAPSLQVTRTVLLPSIFAALVEYLGAVTPQRAQDWFRILSSSAYHITTVPTQDTETGQQFRHALQHFWYSVVECASSPATIQAIVDCVTCWVKLADAIHTPEFRAFLDQLGLASCRIFDAVSAGTNHQLAHGASELAWATAELLADPRTTCAVAEVTAYVCHALEMEHVHRRAPNGTSDPTGDDTRPSKEREAKTTRGPRSWCERSRKRRARDQQQRGTYQGSILLPHSQPPATVEEAILGSLGCEPMDHHDEASDDDEDTSQDDNDDASIPSKVVCTTVKERGSVKDDADVSSRHHDDDGESHGDDGSTGGHSTQRGWYQRVQEGVRSDVNVGILQQSIMGRSKEGGSRNRARSIPVQRGGVSRGPGVAETAPWSDESPNVEDIGDYISEEGIAEALPRSAKRKRLQVEIRMDENGELENEQPVNACVDDAPWPRSQHPERYDGETPVEHFCRVLDEVLALQQGNALHRMAAESSGRERRSGSPRGRVSKPTPSFRDRVAEMRTYVEGEKQEEQQAARRFGIIAYALLAGLLLTFLMFTGFAAYGAYAILSPPTRRALGRGQYSGGPSELVVRVVREVVHVDREGKVLCTASDNPFLEPDRVDRVANCLASEL